jgi:hypothetical protein
MANVALYWPGRSGQTGNRMSLRRHQSSGSRHAVDGASVESHLRENAALLAIVDSTRSRGRPLLIAVK